jgi:L-malate glycosyltransferase
VRILYLTDNDSVHNRRFLEKLVLSGHAVWSWNLAASKPGNNPHAGVQQILSTKTLDSTPSPEQYREHLPQLQSVLTEIRPNLIHAGPIQTAGYLVALSNFHPWLLMSWGSDILTYAERNSEWRNATEIALQSADAFFCDCQTVRGAANKYRTFSDSEIVQFPWGVKRGLFSAEGPTPPDEEYLPKRGTTTFIYTRSFDPLYGTDALLDGFRRARRENPALRLLLLGNGSQSQDIRAYIEACGLRDSVLAVGPQSAEKLPAWFRAADIYISCTKSDGTSISLLEAMATGLPVVVTDIPSNREWVSERHNGWLTTPGSPQSVADKILEAAKTTPQERSAIGERNQRIVSQRADWDRNFPRLLEMYDRLVSSI